MSMTPASYPGDPGFNSRLGNGDFPQSLQKSTGILSYLKILGDEFIIPHLFQFIIFLVFLVSWGGVRLSPLGTAATNFPLVPAPDDR
jgi:hypothetical protein